MFKILSIFFLVLHSLCIRMFLCTCYLGLLVLSQVCLVDMVGIISPYCMAGHCGTVDQ